MAEKRGISRGAMPRVRFAGASILAASIALGLVGGPAAEARPRGDASGWSPVFAWILLDAETGQVISEQNADVLTYPASLTKMMTLYLTFEALNQGRVRLDQLFRVSAEAARRPPSKLGLTPGDAVPLRDLILALITRSANDAAAVIAENLAGSEANFARYMTWKARQLGMQHSWFQNASGLPNPSQRTTARDVAQLSLALLHDFPREYRYFSTQEFYFRGDEINTHNHLLEWYAGADGIKTGFINASGFNIATSAVRNGRRLIGVIMGGRSARSRDLQMASLLDQGFAALGSRQPATPLVASAPAAGSRASSANAIAASAPAATVATAATAVPAPAVSAITAAPAGPKLSSANAIPAAPSRSVPAVSAITAAQAVVAAAEEDEEEEEDSGAETRRTGGLRRAASAALRHLTPVSKAQAAPAVHVKTADDDGWSVQLGAFRDQSAARQVLRRITGLAVVSGKPQQVLAPPKSDRKGLYRARLLRFSESAARSACAALKKRKIACTVVRSSVKLARG
ncbi:MAG: serine hydrolase [Alphaproteobacteria bacterium]